MKKFLLPLALLSFTSLVAFPQKKTAPDSNFKPGISANIPVIKISSKSGNNDFVAKPVASVVTEKRKTWGEIKDDPVPYYEECKVTIVDGNKATAIDNAEAKVKVRGNWTTSYDKKPLRIRFKEKQSVLGMNEGKKNRDWVLMASYKDWSFSRDATGLYLAHMITSGYKSDFRLAEVYVNNKFWGVYVLAELQEVGKERVNITEVKKGYKNTDIGYFLEFDGYSYAEKNKFDFKAVGNLKDINGDTVDISKLESGYTIKSNITNPSQVKFIDNYVNGVWQICYEAAYNKKYLEFDKDYKNLVKSKASNARECVSKVIDIDSMVEAYILSEIVCDPDLYYSSFYFTADFGPEGNKKIYFEAPWDFDSTMGNKNFCADGKGLHAAVKQWDVSHWEQKHCNPWMMVFVNEPWFQSAVKAKWKTIKAGKTVDKLLANIDFITKNYAKSFTEDQKVWANIGNNELVGNELDKESAKCKNQKKAADRLKKWLKARFAYLDSVWK